MNRKLVSKALGDIDDRYLAQSMVSPVREDGHSPERKTKMSKHETMSGKNMGRKMVGLVLAACMVFALAATAYAADLLGIRGMFRNQNRELPEKADSFVQQHTQTAKAEDWRASVTESLCDVGKILTTVNVSGGDRYVIVPTDATAADSVCSIGIERDQTLREYAAAQGKELLFVGASLMQNENLGIFTETQTTVHVSDGEMNILVESGRSGDGAGDAICRVYAVDSEGNRIELEVPFTLEATSAGEGRVYVPVDPKGIPGVTVGEAMVKETPLGLSVRWMETVTDENASNKIMEVEIEGVTYGEGGLVLEDDGNWYFQFSMGEGSIGDTMTAHFYDGDKTLIGDMVFKKK